MSPFQFALVFMGVGMFITLAVAFFIAWWARGVKDERWYSESGFKTWGQTRRVAITVFIGLFVTFIISGIALATTTFDKSRCEHRWGNLSKWGVTSGCLVRLKNGRYVPEDRIHGTYNLDVRTDGGTETPFGSEEEGT